MAVTRKGLKAMGLTDEQVDSIIEMHSETVDALKKERDGLREKAEQYDEVKKELDGIKGGEDWKSKYNAEKKAFEDFKKDIQAKETLVAKENAVKAFFESKGITGANLDIAIRGAKDEIKSIELDGDKIKDSASLDALVAGTYKGLIATTSQQGANQVNPPANTGTKKTKAEILAIKDPAERQREIAKNLDLFGYGANGKE